MGFRAEILRWHLCEAKLRLLDSRCCLSQSSAFQERDCSWGKTQGSGFQQSYSMREKDSSWVHGGIAGPKVAGSHVALCLARRCCRSPESHVFCLLPHPGPHL